jgi:catechol 2,3-dioxygenase-like lactoylglutathione lyase family enzyme
VYSRPDGKLSRTAGSSRTLYDPVSRGGWYARSVLGNASFVGFIPVRDPAVARVFYEDTLGLQVHEENPAALVLNASGTMLRVTPVPELVVQPFTIAGWQTTDIEATVRALVDRGIEFTRYEGMDQDELGVWTTPSGDRVAWFKDPDGNTLSLTPFASQ